MRRLIPMACLALCVSACGEERKGGLIGEGNPTRVDEPIKQATVEGPVNHVPRDVVERAIQAHGGTVRLGRLRQFTRSDRGQIRQITTRVDATRELALALPDRGRISFTVQAGSEKESSLLVVADGKGWVAARGSFQDLAQDNVADLRGEIHILNVLTLVPLMNMELTAIPAIVIDEKPALGIQVSAKGHQDIKLWFDEKTGYLVKAERPGFEGGPITHAYYFSDFKDFDGVLLPTRQRETIDGAFAADWTITKYQVVDSFPDDTFKKP